MTARDDDPRLHRIEVERDEGGEVTSVRFVCDGGDDAPCHHWPACDCETWTDALHGIKAGQMHYIGNGAFERVQETIPPQPGHEDVPQPHCWMDPWFDALGGSPVGWLDAYDGEVDLTIGDLRSGPVSVTFEGDYVTWEPA